MDKKKHSPRNRAFVKFINIVLIFAVLGISVLLVSNYIMTTYFRSVEGTWTGIITDDYDEFIVYDYIMTFTKEGEAGVFSGTTYAQSFPEFRDIHASSSFVGTMEDDILTLNDVRVHDANTGWCRTDTTLELELRDVNGVETLTGNWYGEESICKGVHGRIHLTRAS